MIIWQKYIFYFWATQNGAELDLLITRDGKRYGFEFKAVDAPSTTKSMHSAIESLSLSKLSISYPGEKSYDLTDRIQVLSMGDLEKQGLIV
jgi:predicted AAA+ superfamily ATPase